MSGEYRWERRVDVSGSLLGGEGEVETAEEKGPVGLQQVQAFGTGMKFLGILIALGEGSFNSAVRGIYLHRTDKRDQGA